MAAVIDVIVPATPDYEFPAYFIDDAGNEFVAGVNVSLAHITVWKNGAVFDTVNPIGGNRVQAPVFDNSTTTLCMAFQDDTGAGSWQLCRAKWANAVVINGGNPPPPPPPPPSGITEIDGDAVITGQITGPITIKVSKIA